MSKLNGSAAPDPLDELDDVIAELEGSEWDDDEITAEHILEAVKVGAAAASGKHQAMSKDQAEEITLTDPNIKRPSSVPPKVRALEHILAATNTWPKVVALAVIVAAVVALVLWGSPWVQKVLN